MVYYPSQMIIKEGEKMMRKDSSKGSSSSFCYLLSFYVYNLRNLHVRARGNIGLHFIHEESEILEKKMKYPVLHCQC